ncbi:DUF2480 family protein [Sphingobacterium daejeonense]|uniref:DUF2480 family protein n=1 Tax=Sphingobacterium daejeonense TaxID=371142 RepID=UPI0010C4420E|nr:DUF2480 family protein [Sphingobacterium daejeonense]VTP91728.1 Protein of uncharacterised function (DUF2480) [Sphingobacterium daejeonense]
MVTETFVNKVEASGIVAFDLIDFRPTIEIVDFDIKQLLFMEMIVKEKEFRSAVREIDFAAFKGKAVAVHCSVDAILPSWVYMVLADRLHGNAAYFDFKDIPSLELDLWKSRVKAVDLSPFRDKKVVVRARPELPPTLYMLATDLLKPIVKALMYGEIGMPKVIFK